MARKKGKVINIASTAGKWGSRNQSAYNISKHGVVGLTRCVALEMAPYNINVNAICPWIVETDIIQYGIEQRSKTMGISKENVIEMLKKNSPLGRFSNLDWPGALPWSSCGMTWPLGDREYCAGPGGLQLHLPGALLLDLCLHFHNGPAPVAGTERDGGQHHHRPDRRERVHLSRASRSLPGVSLPA